MHLFDSLLRNGGQNFRRRKPRNSAVTIDLLESRLLLTAVNLADEEQLVLELINRARANPEAEATRLGISLNQGLPDGTISATPKQPLAPNQQLQNASVGHTNDMIDRDFFAHTNPSGVTPGGRATAAGYNWWTIAENIAYIGYFGSVDIDANSREAHDLLFQSPGHRENILMDEVEEIGVGIRSGAFVPSGGNATLVTENFGRRNLNPYITGVVYSDVNNSDFYDIGEAVRSGTITARRVSDGATFSDNIGTSGGYGLIVPAGDYVVTAAFSRNGTAMSLSSSVTVGTDNVKVDFDATTAVTINLSITASTSPMRETGAQSTQIFTVIRSGSTSGALSVNLSSSDTTEVTVPASIVIPDGQASATFTVTALEDGLIDGTQIAIVQASASGAVPVSRSVRVSDSTTTQFAVSALTTTDLRPTFSWASLADASSYEIQIVKAVSGSPLFFQLAGISTNSFQMPVDLIMGDYSIRVRGKTAGGLNSIWSNILICRSRPITTVEGSPRTETTPDFTIRWSEIPGASAYEVLVDRLTSRTSGMLRNNNVVTTSLTVTDFPVGRYQVRVRGKTTTGQLTSWSSPAAIDVYVYPDGLRVTAEQIGSLATLNWNPVLGAVRYDVQIINQTTGATNFVRDPNVAATSLSLPTLTNGSYFAYVRAVDQSGKTYVAPQPYAFQFNSPPKLSLASTALPGQPWLNWRTVAGADRYELVFARTTSDERITVSNLTGNEYQPDVPLASGTWRTWIRAFDSQGHMTNISSVVTIVVASSEPGGLMSWPMESLGSVLGDASQTRPFRSQLLNSVPEYSSDDAPIVSEAKTVPEDSDDMIDEINVYFATHGFEVIGDV